MARLLDESAIVDTLAPPGVFVSANWPTIYTATLPDRHRYLCWEEIRGGTYGSKWTSPRMVRGTPFWKRLSDTGRRVAVLDVPHSQLDEVNGAMLVEWGCHDRHHGSTSWPPQLAGELTARYGKHFGAADPPGFDQFAPCDYTLREGAHRTDDETVALFETICEGLERKRRASLDVLDRGGWDLFLTVMGEAHCIGHQLWHLHDPEHPGYDAALVQRLGGDPIREVYCRLDAVIDDHLSRLSDEDTAYVLLPHGMTAHHDGTHLFDQVLHRLDLGLDDPAAFGHATRGAAEIARLIPRPLRGPALRATAPLLRTRRGPADSGALPPRERRRWFMTPNNTVVGALRLNLEGREPCGRIHPDRRREVLQWLSERLTELVNVDTGGPAVRRCQISEDVYDRSPDDAFGDLFVEWERSAPIERVWSPATGTVRMPYEHWRQGDHVREGLMLATGPGIRGGRRRSASGTQEVGATLAMAAGMPRADLAVEPIDSILPQGVPRRSARRRAVAKARSRLGGAVYKCEKAHVPEWATYRNHVADRLRRDTEAEAAATSERIAALQAQVSELERRAEIAAMMAWLPHAEVPEELLVSVIVPTRDRRERLPDAIDSIEAQSYQRWELLVVDDGSSDDSAEFLAALDDLRIRTFSTPGLGVCAARNLALNAARGDLVAYLDDDNRFDPHWLKAVVLSFNARPQTSVCYGARVFDDVGRMHEGESRGRPGLQFVEWDAEAIRKANFVDMNVLAHRRSPLRFDEQLTHIGDWDLLLRLARDSEPVAVPAVAAYYRTDLGDRLSTTLSDEEIDRDYERVRSKLAASDH